MFGHRIDHNKYNGTRGFGLAYQSCSANVSGGYEMAAVPWLELDGLVQLRGAPGPGLTNQVRDNTVLFVVSSTFLDYAAVLMRICLRSSQKQAR